MLSGGGVKYVKANETLTFEARKAEIVAIVGESGCGKSTFAKVLMGLETATEGTITFNGEKIERSEEHTSELQSLMRISYAIFCLKKKKTIHKQHVKFISLLQLNKLLSHY